MINLLPYTEKKIIHRVRNLRLLNTVLVGGVVLVGVIAVLLFPTFFTLQNRYALYTKEIGLLVQEKKIVNTVDVAALQQKSALLATKLGQAPQGTPLPFMDVPISLASSAISLERVTLSSPTIVDVYGVSVDRASLQAYSATLEGHPLVERVDNPLSNLVKTKDNKFRITIKFKS